MLNEAQSLKNMQTANLIYKLNVRKRNKVDLQANNIVLGQDF